MVLFKVDGIPQPLTDELPPGWDGGLIPSIEPKPIEPVPRKDWPLWAKGLGMLSKPEDKGVGDVVARMIGDENSEAFKAWHLATFGKACNCTARRDRWNRQFPL